LNAVNYRGLKRDPKIISGFSDITALQLAIFRKTRLVTFSGPMPGVEFWKNPDPYSEENFWRLVTSKSRTALINPPGEPLEVLKEGKGVGVILGGNLSLLTNTVGTPYFPTMKDGLLVLEEVEEQPYRVDRMLAQLSNSGVLGQISGLILGKFTGCDSKTPEKPTLSIQQVLGDYASIVKGPVVANLQYGHIPRKLTIPFGIRGRLNSSKNEVELLEGAVE
jgi:muramoyltetrapeptide carboxypeptidase